MMAADGNEDTMHEALRSKKIGFMPPSRQLGTVVHCIQLTELHPNSLQQFLQLILQYFLNIDFHPFRFLTLTPLIFVESHTQSLHL